ncbi:MAG: hypothetical protein WCC77_13985, partial [Pseudolabrys sp.]
MLPNSLCESNRAVRVLPRPFSWVPVSHWHRQTCPRSAKAKNQLLTIFPDTFAHGLSSRIACVNWDSNFRFGTASESDLITFDSRFCSSTWSNDDMLAEHWDVLQDEATEAESQSGLPMFGTKFPG